ncbi:MAG: OmpH family outer membrane protein [Bacteroidales bacterium]|jgi:outer membrane protein|nr:OmpH family outer membrane protein [Bacteroidales bacterium]MCK9448301.1 OmpH family outer membrane protein [Bacteroidales bacterium]MDD3701697.1 OmpH family outer membrane protein [Bacteroidales bacterium]MDY0369906.1 OmpH family outer membrane protein [Bacteroidales bacterium]
MKHIKLTAWLMILIIGVSFSAQAQLQSQRIGYVDTEYILNNIPEYKDAQDELNALSQKWEKEVSAIYEQVEKMYKEYQTEAVLLPADLKRKREDEILQKEKEAKDLQMKYFGAEGDLFKKRAELVQPIQEKIYNAMMEIAETKNYAFIFDKASGATMLYANPRLDLSDEVLDQVGTVMQTVRKEDRQRR